MKYKIKNSLVQAFFSGSLLLFKAHRIQTIYIYNNINNFIMVFKHVAVNENVILVFITCMWMCGYTGLIF